MLFSFLKRVFFPAKKEEIASPITEEGDKWFHGVDLDEWNYLGATRINYTARLMNNEEVETGAGTAFFFSAVDDDDNRKYLIIDHHPNSGKDFKIHPFVIGQVDPWRICETGLWMPVYDFASNYLKEYMLTNYQVVWHQQEDGRWWWKKTEDAKYKAASTKQKAATEAKPEVKQTEDEKIITVKFGKKKD